MEAAVTRNTHTALYEAQEALRLGDTEKAAREIQMAVEAYQRFESRFNDLVKQIDAANTPGIKARLVEFVNGGDMGVVTIPQVPRAQDIIYLNGELDSDEWWKIMRVDWVQEGNHWLPTLHIYRASS